MSTQATWSKKTGQLIGGLASWRHIVIQQISVHIYSVDSQFHEGVKLLYGKELNHPGMRYFSIFQCNYSLS